MTRMGTGSGKSRRARSEPLQRSGYDDALALLSRREHSARELGAKLARRGHSSEESDDAIERLREQHYQSDDRFAASVARHRAGQGYGPVRIRAELKSHDLPDAAIREAIAALDTDWIASAAAQLRRHGRAKAASAAAARAKDAAFLLRRGFDAATVRDVTRTETSDPDLDPD